MTTIASKPVFSFFPFCYMQGKWRENSIKKKINIQSSLVSTHASSVQLSVSIGGGGASQIAGSLAMAIRILSNGCNFRIRQI